MGSSFGCLMMIALLSVLIVFILVLRSKERAAAEKAINEAYQAYQSALARLRKYPTDPDTKRHALEVGRGYSAMTREQKRVALFDEIALMNDINAATAGATAAPPVPQLAASAEARLQELERLRAQGLITDAEYAAKRQRLIDEM